MNAVPNIYDDGTFVLSEKDLFCVSNLNYFAVHSHLKWPEWTRVKGRFEILRFHGLNIAIQPERPSDLGLRHRRHNLKPVLGLPPQVGGHI
jgi:hypothetical protein